MTIRTGVSAVILLLLVTPTIALAQAPGKGADACTLVSKAEIEQTLALKLKDGTKKPTLQVAGTLSSCDWASENDGEVSILIRRNQTKYVPGTEKAEFEKQGMKLRYLTGLGTTAAFVDMFGMGTSLIVFRGDYDYAQTSAMNTGINAKVLPERLEKLTRLLLSRWK